MTKRELIVALEKYPDEAEVFILCQELHGRGENGEELAVYPGLCMLDDRDEVEYLGELCEIIPDTGEEQYQYYGGSGYMA